VARAHAFGGHENGERHHGGEAREDSSHHHPPAAITLPGKTLWWEKPWIRKAAEGQVRQYPGARVRRRRERTIRLPDHQDLRTVAQLYIPSTGRIKRKLRRHPPSPAHTRVIDRAELAMKIS